MSIRGSRGQNSTFVDLWHNILTDSNKCHLGPYFLTEYSSISYLTTFLFDLDFSASNELPLHSNLKIILTFLSLGLSKKRKKTSKCRKFAD